MKGIKSFDVFCVSMALSVRFCNRGGFHFLCRHCSVYPEIDAARIGGAVVNLDAIAAVGRWLESE